MALPPLGPPIDVTPPPNPPSGPEPLPRIAAPRPAAVPAPPAKPTKEPPPGLELSDIWHPYRAVKKGFHWAGEQVPLIGDDNDVAAPQPKAARPAAPRPSAPIPLLPPATASPAGGESSAAGPKPVAPGPGSGGLY